MKNIITLLIISLTLTSCGSIKAIPIKGTYLEKPFIVYTDKTIDEVWSKVIDIFATKGITIKIIDKASGLIVTEDYSFLKSYTFETVTGKPANPNAMVVCSRIVNGLGDHMIPEKITGSWNVRVKSENGKTVININITNLVASRYFPPSQYTVKQTLYLDVKSTGKFEEQIAEMIK